MQLRLLNFSSLVQNMAAAAQAASAQLLDLTIGSILRAVLEANAGIALWLQWLIALVLAHTRAATSTGEDLDSFVGDFSVTRLPASAAIGSVVFARLTAGLAASVPVGALVRTADGTQDFTVIADAAHPGYDPLASAFTLAAGALSITLPVRAATSGARGNAQAGTITSLASAIPGVDNVTNITAMQGGRDAEADAALRARFQNFLDTRSRATARAIAYAIGQVQQGLAFIITENQDPQGNPRQGSFVVVLDDGSGAPSASLLAQVGAAVDAVRPIGSICTVQAPSVLMVAISISLTLRADASAGPIIAAVSQAITGYAAALPIGATLARSRIAQLAHDADAAVLNVANILLNASAADITPPPHGVIKPGIVVVS